MKEQILSEGDRAALQSLIPLAGALGAGTIFALFFGAKRRRAEFAAFEIFAIAAVFACVATTVYFAVALLHQEEAIGGRDLARTAAPLLIAAFLLIFISAFGRLGGSTERVLTLLPLVAVGIFLAFGLSWLSWEAQPGDTIEIAAIIIAVGIVFSLLVGLAWRLISHRGRERAQRLLAELAGRGFLPAERSLHASLPRRREEGELRLAGWERKGRFYIDVPASYRLERQVRDRWDESVDQRYRPLRGSPLLLEVAAPTATRYFLRRRDLSVVLFETGSGGSRNVVAFERLDFEVGHALFDVTDLIRPGEAGLK